MMPVYILWGAGVLALDDGHRGHADFKARGMAHPDPPSRVRSSMAKNR
jgi:hypothetical protein